jgi:hypothetical protein
MTRKYCSRLAAFIFSSTPCRSKFARAMHLVADIAPLRRSRCRKTSQYPTAQEQIYRFDGIPYSSSTGLNSLVLLPELKQST